MKNTFSDDIKKLQDSIQRLQQIKEVLYAVEDVALEVERSVSEIDARIPLRENLHEIKDGEQRAQAEHALDLLDRWTLWPAAPVPASCASKISCVTTNPARTRSAKSLLYFSIFVAIFKRP